MSYQMEFPGLFAVVVHVEVGFLFGGVATLPLHYMHLDHSDAEVKRGEALRGTVQHGRLPAPAMQLV